ncbi:MAG: hypothetical protein IKO51_05285 [Clostridia bacterium]|nr:hypothetical protein [Clostridia bacterium]
MPSDIGVKMSVSGVSQFKSAMNDAKGSVKALDAELKLNAAQYKASGDAETYYANRAKILADQIKAQEEVVSNAEKALETMTSQGVKKADKAYTQMQATLAQAKTRLVEMQQAANGAGDELQETGKTADSTAKSLSKLSAGMAFQNLSKVFDGVDNILKNILTKAVRISETVWNWGRDAGSWADDLATRATMYGMDVETLQGYEYAAKLIDTEVDTIVKASDKLRAKAKDTGDGIALITQGSTQFGIALTDAAGEARSQMDVMWDFLDLLGEIENETDRNALAQEYFGRSYRELIPLIKAGRDAWEQAAEGADVVSEDNVNKLVKMNDTMDELDQKWQTTRMTLLANLAPAFEKVADALDRMMDRIGEWAESDEGQATMSRLGDAVANLIDSFADGTFESLFDTAVGAVEKISEFLQTITGGDMLSALETIGKIIAGWKIAETGIKTWSLIKSLGLGGNAGGAAGGAAGAAAGSGIGSTLLGILKWGSGIGLGALAAHSLLNQSGDAEDEPYWGKGAKIGSYKGKDLYVNGMGYFSYDQNGYARTLGGDYAGLRIFGEEGYFGFQDAFRNAFEGKATGGTYYQLLQESEDSADGLLVQINEAGELMTAYIADVNTFVKEWASETAVNDKMTEAGEQMSESVYEGATANIAAAYNAGAALAAAFADGASSVGAGNGGSATYNSEYVNAVNVYGVTNPDQIAAAYREVLKKQTAGYGG